MSNENQNDFEQQELPPPTLEEELDQEAPSVLEVEGPATWEALVQAVAEKEKAADDAIVQLVNEYKEAIKARDEWADKYLRAAAEFANARRRAEVRADNQVRSARERLLNNILPVLDDFERAFKAVPEDEQQMPWVNGFELIQRKLQGVIDREGVTPIQATGQPFDPSLHQAVMMEETEGVEPGTVVEVLQQGYMLDGTVLRPSMVKVAN